MQRPMAKKKLLMKRRARKRPESWNTRLRQAELLVEQKKYGDAKQILSTLLREQPRRTRPHRLLARVAIGQNDATTSRYHLQRYLILGGADLDGQIKKWLQENPQK